MNWPQLSAGAIVGSVATWLLGVTRSWIDVLIQQRKNVLLRIRTQLRGCTRLQDAAHELQGLHDFFERHPRYIAVGTNRTFLEKWPKTLYDEVRTGQHEAVKTGRESDLLKQLKGEVETLTLS